MTAILVPGVAQTTLQGTIAGNPFACVWHWQFPGDTGLWNAGDIQHLADDLFTGVRTAYIGVFPSNCTVTAVNAVDIGTGTPAVGVSTGAPWTPTGSNTSLTPAACALISFRIAARYKGGHPRTYLPGMTFLAAPDGENVSTTYQNTYEGQFSGFVSGIQDMTHYSKSTGPNHVVVRYDYDYTDNPTKHRYDKTRVGVQGVYPVQTYVCHPKVCTQRRRLKS